MNTVCEIEFCFQMKRSAADSDVGGEGSERGSSASFVAFVCVKCGHSRSGSSFVWCHEGWCLPCVQQYRLERERLRLLEIQRQRVQDTGNDASS